MSELTLPPSAAELDSLATEAEARRGTTRLCMAIDRSADALADVANYTVEAYRRRYDLALGYGSWDEYAEAELPKSSGLVADIRQQLVGMLASQNLPTRAIASVVGVTQQQVSKDVRQVTTELSPVESALSAPAPKEGTDMAAPVAPPEQKIEGLDGKHYPRPGAQSLTEKVREAMSDNEWHTLPELAEKVGTNDATVSARIRDLRKVQFGNHEVPRRRTPSGSYEYRLDGDKSAPAPRSRQVATPTPTPRIGGNRKRHAAVIESMNISLSGLAMAADQITELDNTVTAEKAAQLLDDLSTSIRSLNRLKQQLNTRKVTR